MESYFTKIQHSIPPRTNPAEFLLDLVTADFARTNESVSQRSEAIQSAWADSTESDTLKIQVSRRLQPTEKPVATEDRDRPRVFQVTFALLHRLFIKSYRDFVAYEIRILMYLGMCSHAHGASETKHGTALAIMMGTVWLRLQTSQNYIQPFINAIVSLCTNETEAWMFNLSTVLRIRIYVLHGSSVRSRISRRPRHLYQGAFQRSIWPVTIYDIKFPYWPPIPL